MASSVRGSFGALPLRPTAVIRRTSHEVLLCVAMVLINRAFILGEQKKQVASFWEKKRLRISLAFELKK